MSIRISSELRQQLLDLASASPDLEVCALLFGNNNAVTGFEVTPNVSAQPQTAFEIDPSALIAAHRRMRDGGSPIIGVFHSHPNGRVGPSPDDVAAAEPNGWIWLIAAGGDMSAWIATKPTGFNPVLIECS
jgi:desampylase